MRKKRTIWETGVFVMMVVGYLAGVCPAEILEDGHSKSTDVVVVESFPSEPPSRAAGSVVLDFEDLPPSNMGRIPSSYHGLEWDCYDEGDPNWWDWKSESIDPDYSEPRSGDNYLFNAFGVNNLGFSLPGPVDCLSGAWFANTSGTAATPERVRFNGYDAMHVLVEQSAWLTISSTPQYLAADFGPAARIEVEHSTLGEAWYTMDDLTYEARPVCSPPAEPNNPDPCDGATDVPTDTCLAWNENKASQLRNSFSLDQAILDSDDIKVDLTEVLFNGVGDSIEVAAPVQLTEETRTDDSDVLVYIGNDGRNEGYGDVTAAIAGIGGTTTITSVWPARLDGYCTVYLVVNRSPFDSAQLTSLVNYVNGGGTLVAMGDWDDWAGSANAVMNNVAAALGSSMSITPDRIDMECHLTTLIETHPLTAGVSSLQFGFTSIVNVGSGTLLVSSEPSAVPMLAVEAIGSGLFILCGDSNIFSDLCSGSGDRQQLVQNICGGLECPTAWDLYFGTDPCTLELIASDLDEPNCCPGELECEMTYFWQVVAKNCCGESRGPVWSFTTELCNQDPNCSNAVASISELWPPNHKWQAIEILGVEDPDGDPVSITITGITQDEPVVGIGSGNTVPDGAGIGLGRAFIRAERSGQGNGRVYEIHFEADDGMGGVCNGTVSVCVPHDKGKDGGCIDDGQFYNSRALQLLRADFNDDGKVDQHDFAIFSAYWLDSYELDEAPVDDE